VTAPDPRNEPPHQSRPRYDPRRGTGGGPPGPGRPRGRSPTPPFGSRVPDPPGPAAAPRPSSPRTLRTVRLVRPGARSNEAPPPPSRLRRVLVGLARLLTGGLLMLAVVVAGLPPLLSDRGPGLGVVVGHIVAALLALAATVVAAARRPPPGVAVVAAAVVPVLTVGVLAGYWWA